MNRPPLPRPRRLLVVKLGAIGDTVHAVPAVAALRRHYPDTHLTWCTERAAFPLVSTLAEVDAVVPIDTRAWRRLRRLTGRAGPWAAWRRLRQGAFDVAIDFQGLLKSALAARLIGAPRRLGWSRPWLREVAAARFYTDPIPGLPPDRHVIDQCAALTAPLGVPQPVPWVFPYRIPETAGRSADALIAATAGSTPFVILNPGAAWPTKRWPPQAFGRLAEHLWREQGLSVLVTYGPGEEHLAAEIRATSPTAHPAPCDLLTLAALAGQCRCFVSGDTGPMHLASAVGAPVVGLFGPTQASRNGPFHPADIALSLGRPCAGCHLRACESCDCMEFTVEDVLAAVRRRMADGGPAHGCQ